LENIAHLAFSAVEPLAGSLRARLAPADSAAQRLADLDSGFHGIAALLESGLMFNVSEVARLPGETF
jgi:hypothetical protein